MNKIVPKCIDRNRDEWKDLIRLRIILHRIKSIIGEWMNKFISSFADGKGRNDDIYEIHEQIKKV